MTINDSDFQRLVSFVRQRYGINLEHKRQLIDARLSFDISRRGYGDFTRYVNRVTADPEGEECQRMINKLSTNYTFFFREVDYIAQLNSVVLPELLAAGTRRLRVWSAACSSGQEAYSLAMVLELQRRLGCLPVDFEIVGTDINTEMLQQAAAGQYSAAEAEQIPLRYRGFCAPCGGGMVEVAAELRRKITWRYENLLEPLAADEYDIVFCRNVMIYFTPQLRREMERKLSGALRPGCYLFTGATESIDLERRYFRYIAPAFYQKARRSC